MAIGVVDYAAPVGVFPWELVRAFRRSQIFPVVMNEYPNGESQRVSPAFFSRRIWELAEDLDPVKLGILRAFYISHNGPTIPFIFYDVSETFPLFSFDPDGLALDGQYIGRFDGAFEQSVRIGKRGSVNLRIVEVV